MPVARAIALRDLSIFGWLVEVNNPAHHPRLTNERTPTPKSKGEAKGK